MSVLYISCIPMLQCCEEDNPLFDGPFKDLLHTSSEASIFGGSSGKPVCTAIFILRRVVSLKMTFFLHKGHKPTPSLPLIWPLAVELEILCWRQSRQNTWPQEVTVARLTSSKQIGHWSWLNDLEVSLFGGCSGLSKMFCVSIISISSSSSDRGTKEMLTLDIRAVLVINCMREGVRRFWRGISDMILITWIDYGNMRAKVENMEEGSRTIGCLQNAKKWI